MNEIQIKCFLAIAEKNSFTKAANEIFMSQPNLSRHIKGLEEELGMTLFDRTTKNVKLTQAGELYYELFRRFVLEFQETKKKAGKLNTDRQGTIRMGCIEGWKITRFMPRILESFSKEYPGIEITLECDHYDNLIKALKLKRLDVILCMDISLKNETGIEKEEIAQIQRVILYSEYHKLAQKEDLTPCDFRNEIFFASHNEENIKVDEEIRGYCKPYGFVPKIKYVQNTESMLASVQNGLGVAIYDVWGRNLETEGFRHILLDSYHPVSMAWRADNENASVSILVNEILFLMKQSENPYQI